MHRSLNLLGKYDRPLIELAGSLFNLTVASNQVKA